MSHDNEDCRPEPRIDRFCFQCHQPTGEDPFKIRDFMNRNGAMLDDEYATCEDCNRAASECHDEACTSKDIDTVEVSIATPLPPGKRTVAIQAWCLHHVPAPGAVTPPPQ